MTTERRNINQSPLIKVKKNVYLGGRRTSIHLESYVWEQLDRLSREASLTMDELCTAIEISRPDHFNISAVIRYVTLQVSVMRERKRWLSSDTEQNNELNEAAVSFPSALRTILADINNASEDTANGINDARDPQRPQNLKTGS